MARKKCRDFLVFSSSPFWRGLGRGPVCVTLFALPNPCQREGKKREYLNHRLKSVPLFDLDLFSTVAVAFGNRVKSSAFFITLDHSRQQVAQPAQSLESRTQLK